MPETPPVHENHADEQTSALVATESPIRRAKGIYLLPNLFTTAGLFAGFYAVVGAMRGLFEISAIAIFVAMIMDGLDGRVARMTNTHTAFGAQYDSISDMVAFGVAPALVVYSWGLSIFGKLGWLVAFIFAAGGALRLARFNTQIGMSDKRYFRGLPIPSAAAVIAGLVWVAAKYDITGLWLKIVALLLTAIVAVLMVSNFRYDSFKQLDMRGKVPFVAILLMVVVFAAIAINPAVVLFAGFLIYTASGPLRTLAFFKRN